MKIIPTKNRILIRPEEKNSISGGIYIPKEARKDTTTAVVVAVGNDNSKLAVKVGDNVMFDKFCGQEIFLDNVLHLMIRESDIFCVCDN